MENPSKGDTSRSSYTGKRLDNARVLYHLDNLPLSEVLEKDLKVDFVDKGADVRICNDNLDIIDGEFCFLNIENVFPLPPTVTGVDEAIHRSECATKCYTTYIARHSSTTLLSGMLKPNINR